MVTIGSPGDCTWRWSRKTRHPGWPLATIRDDIAGCRARIRRSHRGTVAFGCRTSRYYRTVWTVNALL